MNLGHLGELIGQWKPEQGALDHDECLIQLSLWKSFSPFSLSPSFSKRVWFFISSFSASRGALNIQIPGFVLIFFIHNAFDEYLILRGYPKRRVNFDLLL